MNRRNGFTAFIQRVEQLMLVRVVRTGLIHMIPVLIIGAFALILQTFPADGYQRFLTTEAGGFLLQLFQLVNSATFGVLSLYMTYTISRAYMDEKADPDAVGVGAPIAALLSFFILAGANLSGFGTDSMGPKSMFLAVITGIGASALYLALHRVFRRKGGGVYSRGADRRFNRMLTTLFPIAITAVVFALINAAVTRLFGVESFRQLLIRLFTNLFSHIRLDFFRGLFFVFLSSLLWFFGIHGSDVLEDVMQTYFAPGLAVNQAAAASGGQGVVLTKEFFDCFVLMGGCGATICLLIAILLFSRSRARRSLGLTAAFPMLFNINELMVFGLPIIYNPAMLIPFLLVPLVCYSVAYLALSTGLVPLIASEVAWTTPILLGGLRATGSIAGSALQLVNVALGVAIYLPFVRLLDRQSEASMQRDYESLVDFFRDNEKTIAAVRITELDDAHGDYAKSLCAELRHGLPAQVALAYQPQYDYAGKCVGVEALLRWKHPVHGMLYPPLVVKLAEEGGFLPDLEEAVLLKALGDRQKVLERFGNNVKLSVNVTGTTVVTARYLRFLRQLDAREPLADKNLCLEVTEQAALAFNDETLEALRALRELGLRLAIDDFSMGQTSLHYLKDDLFDIIKLDGALVRGLDGGNGREIISSITRLAASLGMTVLAEYVETEKQRDELHEIGCDCYQGWLYSPAVAV